jgi:hypothetical protein
MDLRELKHFLRTQNNFTMVPDPTLLIRMSESELKSVVNFRIENDFASIEWKEAVDLTGFDFENWILMDNLVVEVYPDRLFCVTNPKPAIGTKLNKECLITFKNAKLISRVFNNNWSDLSLNCLNQGCQFVAFDEKTKSLSVSAAHFTRYCFDFDEEEDENEKVENASEKVGEFKDVQSNNMSIHSKQIDSAEHWKRLKATSKKVPENLDDFDLFEENEEQKLNKGENEKEELVVEKEQESDSNDESLRGKGNRKIVDFELVSEPDTVQTFPLNDLSSDLKVFESENQLIEWNTLPKLDYQNETLSKRIAVFNQKNNSKPFTSEHSSLSKSCPFYHKPTPSFCWASFDKLFVIETTIDSSVQLNFDVGKLSEMDSDVVQVVADVLGSEDLGLVSAFRHNTIRQTHFFRFLLMISEDAEKKSYLKLEQDKRNFFQLVELILSLFVCNKKSPDKLQNQKSVLTAIDEEKQSLDVARSNKVHFAYLQRRKLFKWLDKCLRERRDRPDEAELRKNIEQEEAEELSLQAVLERFRVDKNQFSKGDFLGTLSKHMRLAENSKLLTIEEIMREVVLAVDKETLGVFEWSVLSTLLMYSKSEEGSDCLYDEVIGRGLASVPIEYKVILLSLMCGIASRGQSERMSADFDFVQKQICFGSTAKRLFHFGLLWNLMCWKVFQNSLKVFDSLVSLFFCESTMAKSQDELTMGIIRSLEVDHSGEKIAYQPESARVLREFVRGNKRSIFDFYTKQGMPGESLSFFVKTLTAEQLENLPKDRLSLDFLEEHMLKLSQIEYFASNTVLLLIDSYLKVVRVFHSDSNPQNESILSEALDAVFCCLKECSATASADLKKIRSSIYNGINQMVSGGLFSSYPEAKQRFIQKVITGEFQIKMQKGEFESFQNKTKSLF